MNQSLPDLISAFPDLNVLVIGDAMLDSYIQGPTERLSREAPVPIVSVTSRKDAPGGAANAAANVHALGGNVRLLSIIGDDAEGSLLLRLLSERGIALDDVLVHPGRQTLAKSRVLAGPQMLVRFDSGTTVEIDDEYERMVIDRLIEDFLWANAVVVSDYGYGLLTPQVVQTLADLQERSRRILVADAKDLLAYREVHPTAIKPNYDEVVRLLNVGHVTSVSRRIERIIDCGDRILEDTGAQVAAVTLDEDGALIFERGRPAYRTYAHPASNSRAAGAGDTFVGALALALAAGAETPAAAEIASSAANMVVTKEGTSVCDIEELRMSFTGGEKHAFDRHELARRLRLLREQGKRIVFTNGCFDIIHRGHVSYLSQAKALGDVLVVGVNSDESVQRLKGPDRPINTLDDRLQILAALSCVNYLVPFDEDTPEDLIRAVRPDVYVKGGDYTLDTLPEAHLVESLGGVVEILPYLEERSTTGIISRIRSAVAS